MAKRADNNDGSCREILTGRHAGKWRVQFVQELETGQKRRLSRLLPNKTEAKTFLQSLRRGERIEAVQKKRQLTLASWTEWLSENDWPESLAPATIGYRKARFRKYISKHLGHVPLSKLDAIQVRALYKHLRETGVSEPLLREIRADLVRVFNQAVSPYQRIPSSVANPFRLPLPRPKPRDAVALSPEEVRAAIAAEDLSASQRAMLGLFLLAGLRLGEVMAITWGQIRFDDNLIVIDRAVRVAFGGQQSVGLPKGDKTRNAVMCDTLKQFLLAYRRDESAERLLWPAATENKPRMKKLVYASWRTIKKAGNLPTGMSPHDCRLTHVNLVEKLMPSVSPTTLKEHIGHASVGVTEANYTRPLSSAQAILRDELDRLFSSCDVPNA